MLMPWDNDRQLKKCYLLDKGLHCFCFDVANMTVALAWVPNPYDVVAGAQWGLEYEELKGNQDIPKRCSQVRNGRVIL